MSSLDAALLVNLPSLVEPYICGWRDARYLPGWERRELGSDADADAYSDEGSDESSDESSEEGLEGVGDWLEEWTNGSKKRY